jgi:hypothetical protein
MLHGIQAQKYPDHWNDIIPQYYRFHFQESAKDQCLVFELRRDDVQFQGIEMLLKDSMPNSNILRVKMI